MITASLFAARKAFSSGTVICGESVQERELGILLPHNQRQRRTCYALCHIRYPVSATHTSIFRIDSNSTFYKVQEDLTE